MQYTCFPVEADLAEVAQRHAKSTLTAFYNRNRVDPAARSVLYHDFPSHFTYNKGAGAWTPRLAGPPPVGRM